MVESDLNTIGIDVTKNVADPEKQLQPLWNTGPVNRSIALNEPPEDVRSTACTLIGELNVEAIEEVGLRFVNSDDILVVPSNAVFPTGMAAVVRQEMGQAEHRVVEHMRSIEREFRLVPRDD